MPHHIEIITATIDASTPQAPLTPQSQAAARGRVFGGRPVSIRPISRMPIGKHIPSAQASGASGLRLVPKRKVPKDKLPTTKFLANLEWEPWTLDEKVYSRAKRPWTNARSWPACPTE